MLGLQCALLDQLIWLSGIISDGCMTALTMNKTLSEKDAWLHYSVCFFRVLGLKSLGIALLVKYSVDLCPLPMGLDR